LKILKQLLLIPSLLIASFVFAQRNDDRKIIIAVTDTINIYEKVKYALVNMDFMVKDNGHKDSITTYSRESNGIYCAARAIIEGNIVTLTGVYGLKRIDDWGYTQSPKNYRSIIYYKGSKTWKIPEQVANRIGGEITYDK
jgi:hypothetical protein